MENKDLREQFQLLQEQQQQKLLERRKKKEQANKNKEDKTDSKNDSSSKFGVSDDLGLKLTSKPHEGTGYLSEELVYHLNDQIREMKDENGRLYKLLSERDFEIRQLKKRNEEISDTFPDGGVTNETAATKIIELSKKVRQLTAEKEAEKTKCKQLQKKCNDLQQQLLSKPPPTETQSVTGSVVSLKSNVDGVKDDETVDVKALQDRLKQSETRAADFRNHCQSLRQELKIAHKVLTQEIGENVNMQTLLNETSNWRGRAQQIITLQQKVDELRGQLDVQQSENSSEKALTARRKQEEKHREELKKIEKERREAQENAALKLKSLEVENQSLKDKLDAAKARNKVLSNEIKSQKAQVQTLLRKSRNDDEFIDALMKQQEQMKKLLENHTKQQTQQQHLQQQQLHQMSMKSQQDNNVVEQLKTIASQKEAQVKMLEMELQHLKNVHIQNYSASGVWPAQQDIKGYEKATASVDSRPSTTSDSEIFAPSDNIPSAYNSARSRSASRATDREATVIRGSVAPLAVQKELSTLQFQFKEAEVMSRTMEVERDKMRELVQLLQGRLAEETQKLCDSQVELQTQKRQIVELEKRLARQNLEANKKKGATKVPNSARDASINEGSDFSHMDKNEIITRLEIQNDENESLKSALQRTLKAKEEDLRVYSTTLEETKKVFLQALRQMKEKQTVQG